MDARSHRRHEGLPRRQAALHHADRAPPPGAARARDHRPARHRGALSAPQGARRCRGGRPARSRPCGALAKARISSTGAGALLEAGESPPPSAWRGGRRFFRAGVGTRTSTGSWFSEPRPGGRGGARAHDWAALVPVVEGAGGVVTDWQGRAPGTGSVGERSRPGTRGVTRRRGGAGGGRARGGGEASSFAYLVSFDQSVLVNCVAEPPKRSMPSRTAATRGLQLGRDQVKNSMASRRP